jgi:diaminohydroxyphosphoribosylaminopyrimidine deaminase/5-amino-6-(5-phosphoribosylamino)uracil reductase
VDYEPSYMHRAFELAERGRPTVSPNPMVGCVLVRDGEVVGEGFHERAGAPHAEVVALRAAGDRANGATAYVTLEPCNHSGRTGPCAQALIDAGVTAVVAAAADPHPQAAGGADALRRAGVQVSIGDFIEQSREQNEVFFFGVQHTRPLVIAKVAVSLDGRIAAADGTSRWLTGEKTRWRVHLLRAEVDAVVVGSGTVLADDPQLTVRLPGYGGKQPLRVVMDRRGRVGTAARIHDSAAQTLVSAAAPAELLDDLWQREIRSVLVEGGAAVLHSFLEAGLVDRLHVHVAPVLLGEQGRPALVGPWAQTLSDAPRFALRSLDREGDDVLLTYTTAAGI